MKLFKKRIPHVDLLEILPDKINRHALLDFIDEEKDELLKIDTIPEINTQDLYHDTKMDGYIFMLTPDQCKYIIKSIIENFEGFEENDYE